MQVCALYKVTYLAERVNVVQIEGRPPDSLIPVVVGSVYGESILFIESQDYVLPSDRQRQQEISFRSTVRGEFEFLCTINSVRYYYHSVYVCTFTAKT